MTYKNLVSKKEASKTMKIDTIPAYIAYTDDDRLVSNFLGEKDNPTDNQLIKATEEGLLKPDFDTLLVR